MSGTQEEGIYVCVTGDPLKLGALSHRVEDPSAGAIATFTGVTRNTFAGKEVLKLEYEAYVPMAEKKMLEICKDVKDKWEIKSVAIAHRTGTVEVGEPSVMIAACAWAIDELKAIVPIWKKEFFVGGEIWKENAESRASNS